MKIIFVIGMGMKFLAIQKQKWGNLSKIKVSHTLNQCGRWDLNPINIFFHQPFIYQHFA